MIVGRTAPAPTAAEIEGALGYAAELVETYGDACLPYFLLLESALEAALAKQDVLSRVRDRVRKSGSGTRMVHMPVHTANLSSR